MTSHGKVVQHLAPTRSDPKGDEWQVGPFTVATAPVLLRPVLLYVEIDGLPVELPVPDPETLARALLSAKAGEW